jgi:hypothetical protein
MWLFWKYDVHQGHIRSYGKGYCYYLLSMSQISYMLSLWLLTKMNLDLIKLSLGSTQPREYNWGATWWKSSGSCLENREYGWRDPSRWPRGTLYPHKLAIASPTSGGRSVGIVRSRTQAMEFFFFFFYHCKYWIHILPIWNSGKIYHKYFAVNVKV